MVQSDSEGGFPSMPNESHEAAMQPAGEFVDPRDAELARLRQENEELRYLATHNPVSELWNELGLQQQFLELRRTLPDTPLAVIVLNLENFSALNDELGREGGNELLREAGKRLLSKTETGIVAHTHDDQYIVCQPLPEEDDSKLDNIGHLNAVVGNLTSIGHELKTESHLLAEIQPILAHFRFGISAGGVIIAGNMSLNDAISQAVKKMNEVKNIPRREFVARNRPILEAVRLILASIDLSDFELQKYRTDGQGYREG